MEEEENALVAAAKTLITGTQTKLAEKDQLLEAQKKENDALRQTIESQASIIANLQSINEEAAEDMQERIQKKEKTIESLNKIISQVNGIVKNNNAVVVSKENIHTFRGKLVDATSISSAILFLDESSQLREQLEALETERDTAVSQNAQDRDKEYQKRQKRQALYNIGCAVSARQIELDFANFSGSPPQESIIRNGNEAAHGENAIAHAHLLCSHRPKHDMIPSIPAWKAHYEEMYGVPPEITIKYSNLSDDSYFPDFLHIVGFHQEIQTWNREGIFRGFGHSPTRLLESVKGLIHKVHPKEEIKSAEDLHANQATHATFTTLMDIREKLWAEHQEYRSKLVQVKGLKAFNLRSRASVSTLKDVTSNWTF